MFFSILAAALSSSAWVTCPADVDEYEIFNEESQKVVTHLYEDWPEYVCNYMEHTGYQIEFRQISVSNRIVSTDQDINERGKFEVGSFRAGRLNLNWRSLKGSQKDIWLQLKINTHAWVYKNDLPIGHELTSEDVKKEMRDISNYYGVNTLVNSIPQGVSVGKYVRDGDLVFEEELRSSALVKRHSRVKVFVETGSIFIQTMGMAQSIGWRLGDKVSVKLDDSNMIIEGLVSQEGVINVEM